MQGVADKVKIRLGIDSGRRVILDLGVPLLVSANSMWDNDKKRFRGYRSYIGRDVALDSSGFTAMKLYGGYRWTAEQYADLAKKLNPTWWAQMDFCCEPEIAGSRAEVERRIQKTIEGLALCQSAASAISIGEPMPVLQGYEPSDYVSGPIFDKPFPTLVGVGSVCRRHLKGRNGLLAVVDSIHSALPPHVELHLFGVKGPALETLMNEFPRRQLHSDSCAYGVAARREAKKLGIPKDSAMLQRHAIEWLRRNDFEREDQFRL